MLRHERKNLATDPGELREKRGASAAPTALEAAMYQLREDGIESLKDPSCLSRLDEMSSVQLKEIVGRLKALKSNYPEISKELIAYLAQLRRRKGND